MTGKNMKQLRLYSGLRIVDPATVLRRKFAIWPYERYDAHEPKHSDRITAAEIERSYRLGNRARKDRYRAYTDGRRGMPKLLRAIPSDVALEDADLQELRGPLHELLSFAMAPKGIKVAAATKVLHLMKPFLIPVIDSIVMEYYWYATSLNHRGDFERLAATGKTSPERVLELMRLMARDGSHGRRAIDAVLAHCADCDFRDVPRNRVIESCIWYHYARPGAADRGGLRHGLV